MKFKYTVGGMLFGLCFPAVSWLIDFSLISSLPFTFEGIQTIHENTPLHYIIDTAPFFLGLAFGFAGHKQDIIIKERNLLDKLIKDKTIDLANKNKELSENILDLASKNKKIEEIAFLNSHSVRKYLSTLQGLLNLLEYKDMDQKDLDYITENIKTTSEKLDKSIKEIAEHLYKK